MMLYMLTPFQIICQATLCHPDWTWEEHALNLTRQGFHVCARYGEFSPMQIRMWIREVRVIRRRYNEARKR